MRKTKGFTLAEVLITLGIIGIIAAMTVPNLMQSWKKQARLSQLKVAYSIISNAIKMATAENGDFTEWDYQIKTGGIFVNPEDNKSTGKAFAEKYFIPYVKTKDHGQFKDEYNNYDIYLLNGNKVSSDSLVGKSYAVVLENGMIVMMLAHFDVDAVKFIVDLNGFKGPNMYGNDIFFFSLSPDNEFKVGGSVPADDSYCTTADTSGANCALKILNNGWKIPDDYPIKKW